MITSKTVQISNEMIVNDHSTLFNSDRYPALAAALYGLSGRAAGRICRGSLYGISRART